MLWYVMLLGDSAVTWRKLIHNDIIKRKHFPRYWPFERWIRRSLVNSLHKGQWCRALMFSLICAWINDWVNNHEAGGLRCHLAHYDVTGMCVIMRPFCICNLKALKLTMQCSILGVRFSMLLFISVQLRRARLLYLLFISSGDTAVLC